MMTSNGLPAATRPLAHAHALQRREIEVDDLDVSAVDLACFVAVARGANDVRAMRRERARGLDAKTGGDASDEDALAGEVETLEDLICC